MKTLKFEDDYGNSFYQEFNEIEVDSLEEAVEECWESLDESLTVSLYEDDFGPEEDVEEMTWRDWMQDVELNESNYELDHVYFIGRCHDYGFVFTDKNGNERDGYAVLPNLVDYTEKSKIKTQDNSWIRLAQNNGGTIGFSIGKRGNKKVFNLLKLA